MADVGLDPLIFNLLAGLVDEAFQVILLGLPYAHSRETCCLSYQCCSVTLPMVTVGPTTCDFLPAQCYSQLCLILASLLPT